jgi:hypothetical protein
VFSSLFTKRVFALPATLSLKKIKAYKEVFSSL